MGGFGRWGGSLVLPWCQFVYRGVLKVSDKRFLLVFVERMLQQI